MQQRQKVKNDAAEYQRLYNLRRKEARAARQSEIAKRRSSRRSSRKTAE